MSGTLLFAFHPKQRPLHLADVRDLVNAVTTVENERERDGVYTLNCPYFALEIGVDGQCATLEILERQFEDFASELYFLALTPLGFILSLGLAFNAKVVGGRDCSVEALATAVQSGALNPKLILASGVPALEAAMREEGASSDDWAAWREPL